MYELFDTIKLSHNDSNHTPGLRRQHPWCYCWSCLLRVSSDLLAVRSAECLPVIVLRTWFMPHSEIELLFSKRIAPFQIHCTAITRSMEAKFLIESNGLFSSMIYAGEEVQILWPEDGNNPATADSSDKLNTTGWKIKGDISQQLCNISSPSIIFQAQNYGEWSLIIMTKECALCSLQTVRDNFHLMMAMVAIWLFTSQWWQLPGYECGPRHPGQGNWMSQHYPPGEPLDLAWAWAGCFSF